MTATAFVALFSIVGLALYGLPFYYDFMVRDFGWSRAQVTSGNALSKLLVGPLFGFGAGWIVDRFGPRRLMIAGILMAGGALVGLGAMSALWMFYFFYFFNALGYVCGGPLPNQVLLSRWFDKARGKAMGFAYLGIGIGGAIVPLLSPQLVDARLAGGRAAVARRRDRRARSAARLLRPRRAHRWRQRRVTPDAVPAAGAVWRSVGGCSATGLLPARDRQHVLDCGGRRHEPAPEAVPEPRPRYAQGGGARRSLARARVQHRRPAADGMARRSVPEEARDAPDLSAGRRVDPAAARRRVAPALYPFAIVFGLGLGGEYMIIPLMAAELFGVARARTR